MEIWRAWYQVFIFELDGSGLSEPLMVWKALLELVSLLVRAFIAIARLSGSTQTLPTDTLCHPLHSFLLPSNTRNTRIRSMPPKRKTTAGKAAPPKN